MTNAEVGVFCPPLGNFTSGPIALVENDGFWRRYCEFDEYYKSPADRGSSAFCLEHKVASLPLPESHDFPDFLQADVLIWSHQSSGEEVRLLVSTKS